MKFLTFLLLFIPTSTFACWAPCPEGKECYFEDVWNTPAELEEMASNTNDGKCNAATPLYDMAMSTGAAYHYSCVDGKVHVQQTAANQRMRIKGEELVATPKAPKGPKAGEPLPLLEKGANTNEEELAEEESPEFSEIASKCEVGKGQQACLDAHSQLVEAAARRLDR